MRLAYWFSLVVVPSLLVLLVLPSLKPAAPGRPPKATPSAGEPPLFRPCWVLAILARGSLVGPCRAVAISSVAALRRPTWLNE